MRLSVVQVLLGNAGHQRIVCTEGLAVSGRSRGKGAWMMGGWQDVLGLGSVRREHTESSTFEMVRAGLQLSFKMSRQMAPELLILQW